MYWWQGKKYHRESLVNHLQKRLSDKIEKWESNILSFAIDWLDEHIQSFEVKTSGSTGKPKLISLSRLHMKESARATADYFGLSNGDTALLVLPADFIAGKMMIVRALEIGLDLYYYPPQVSVINHINRDFDFGAFIPLQIQYAIDSGQVEKLAYIATSIIGGASLSQTYIDTLQNLHSKFYATYGMTETITHVAMKNLKESDACFEALPGIKFSVDKNQCLQIKSKRLPEFVTSTNDIVKLISESTFELKGRLDHIINSGGLKIIPEEIEEHIKSILQKEVFIGFQKDEKLGQKLVMVWEENGLNESEIIKMLSAKIDRKYLPKKVLNISSFIRTENQKIDRKKMQDWILKL